MISRCLRMDASSSMKRKRRGMMMKPKVLPGLTGASLDLLWVSEWFSSCHLHVRSWGDVGRSGRNWHGLVSHPVALFWAAAQGKQSPTSS